MKKIAKLAEQGERLGLMLANSITTARLAFMRRFSGEQREIEKECGHPHFITVEDYERAYRRGDIARRVVNLFPSESWSDEPLIYETEDEAETDFETEWNNLCENLNIIPILQRIDIMSGIGRFGILLLGFDDGQTLDTPVAGIGEDGISNGSGKSKLIFLRTFDEQHVEIQQLQTDSKNPRFGKPLFYNVSFTGIGTATNETIQQQSVHWSRVIHVADNRHNSEIYGMPRMEVVFNRLLDLKKVAGGSGEMFWKGGFPGLSLEAMPQIAGEQIVVDQAATKKQMEEYQEGLKRYIALEGMTAKTLSPNIADPTSSVNVQLRLIATALGIPWRILVGSEAAQLASEQDTRAWNRRIMRRRKDYINPFILRPFIDRLMAVNVLPEVESYIIDWPGLNESEGKEKAEIAQAQTTAISQYVQSGGDSLIPPFQYLTLILGFTDAEANSIIDSAVQSVAVEEDDSNAA